jgi:hypothetical protein
VTDSFLFDAVDLRDAPIPDEAKVSAVRDAAGRLTGWSCADTPLTRGSHALGFDCAGPNDLGLRVSFSLEDPEWTVAVLDSQLTLYGRPDEPAQTLTANLIRTVLQEVPPYLGTAVWPFGPLDPEIYDLDAPFRLRQVGPLLFLSKRYLDTQLGGSQLVDAPVWRREELAGGILLQAYPDLLYSPDDPPLGDLRAYLDQAHEAGSA